MDWVLNTIKHDINDHLGSLVILESFIKNKETYYKVHCTECAKDSELNMEAIYEVSRSNLLRGSKPCCCSVNPKYTLHQKEILCRRAADKINAQFLGFVDSTSGQNTKTILHCNICNERWFTCSVANLRRGRGCPSCAKTKRGALRLKPEEEVIQRFLNTGVFDPSTKFKRIKGRLWEVNCPICKSTVESDKSNLLAGKLPCKCSSGGGFDKTRPAYFYILSAEGFSSDLCGFGITSYYKRRLEEHKRELNKIGMSIDRFAYIPCSGYLARNIERLCIDSLPRNSHQACGFKVESTFYDYFDSVLNFAEDYLETKATFVVNEYAGCYLEYTQDESF